MCRGPSSSSGEVSTRPSFLWHPEPNGKSLGPGTEQLSAHHWPACPSQIGGREGSPSGPVLCRFSKGVPGAQRRAGLCTRPRTAPLQAKDCAEQHPFPSWSGCWGAVVPGSSLGPEVPPHRSFPYREAAGQRASVLREPQHPHHTMGRPSHTGVGSTPARPSHLLWLAERSPGAPLGPLPGEPGLGASPPCLACSGRGLETGRRGEGGNAAKSPAGHPSLPWPG